MTTRTLEEIENIFREIGLTEKTWGQGRPPDFNMASGQSSDPQIFVRIETTTTPLKEKPDANLAQSPQ